MNQARRKRHPLITVLVTGLVGVSPLLAGIGALGSLATRNQGLRSDLAIDNAEVVLTARRLNTILMNDVYVAELRNELADFSASLNETSCLSVAVDSRSVVEVNKDKGVIPASNIKILTALVALDVLGPDYQFETQAVGNVVDGVVQGDLYIVGGGDPVLSLPNYPDTEQYPTLFYTDINVLLDGLVNAGVRKIMGSVVGDGSLFDEQRYPAGWSDEIRKAYGGPIGGLMLDDGIVFGLSAKPDDPGQAAAQEISARLRLKGVTVFGAAKAGAATPNLKKIASVKSAPLSDIITEMLTNSDNNTAEMLLKMIGVQGRNSGSTSAGAEIVIDTLQKWGYETADVIVSDGSGLDRGNTIKCSLVSELLQSDRGRFLISRMAIGGTTGTLIDSFTEPPGLGSVRAKTGSLTGVKALSGFITDSADSPSFSLIMNGPGVNDAAYYLPKWTTLIAHLFQYGSKGLKSSELDIRSK